MSKFLPTVKQSISWSLRADVSLRGNLSLLDCFNSFAMTNQTSARSERSVQLSNMITSYCSFFLRGQRQNRLERQPREVFCKTNQKVVLSHPCDRDIRTSLYIKTTPVLLVLRIHSRHRTTKPSARNAFMRCAPQIGVLPICRQSDLLARHANSGMI